MYHPMHWNVPVVNREAEQAMRADAREFILTAVADGARNLAKQLQDEFGVARTTANRYIDAAIEAGLIQRVSRGNFSLVTTQTEFSYPIEGLEEHTVWRNDIRPLLTELPDNVDAILHYGCTEMINNCIDHSEGTTVMIDVQCTARTTRIEIYDDGVGVFRKIADSLDLDDERQSVLELAKGKFTTDPNNHTGEGIFFTCRAMDSYSISSRGTHFSHRDGDDMDWVIGTDYVPVDDDVTGTLIDMRMENNSATELDDIYSAYQGEELGFVKTIVPVRLLAVGEDRLVSRSQAKRLLNRFDRFKEVVLDFDDVESVGQAFADEVFRVFVLAHPEVKLVPIRQNEAVSRMITRALAHNDLLPK
jgi:anti-sigma regulatory factor (Ser/Thr protein kinase)